nr:MAG TPA: hypothetical protein [Bacteriophage sp.]
MLPILKYILKIASFYFRTFFKNIDLSDLFSNIDFVKLIITFLRESFLSSITILSRIDNQRLWVPR